MGRGAKEVQSGEEWNITVHHGTNIDNWLFCHLGDKDVVILILRVIIKV